MDQAARRTMQWKARFWVRDVIRVHVSLIDLRDRQSDPCSSVNRLLLLPLLLVCR